MNCEGVTKWKESNNKESIRQTSVISEVNRTILNFVICENVWKPEKFKLLN